MTDECIETIRRMALDGMSGMNIAEAIHYSKSAVYNACKENGITLCRSSRGVRWRVTDKETGRTYTGTMAELEKQVYVDRSALYKSRRTGGRYIVRRIG